MEAATPTPVKRSAVSALVLAETAIVFAAITWRHSDGEPVPEPAMT